MKSKFGVELPSDRFGGELPSEVEQRGKMSKHRESITPKIVVCPPMEEVQESMSIPRGARLLRALSRKLSRRANDDDSLGSSSSNDSVAGDRGDDHSSCSVSDSGSDASDRRRHRSTVSLRRVFQSLNLTSRSHSSSPADKQRSSKKQTQPQRILRPPVTYTYVRGLSGLPTQRIPRQAVYCAPSGLNR